MPAVKPSDVEFDVQTFLAETQGAGTDLDSMVFGIDEAGRGPVVGDMVYAGAMVALRHHDALVKTGAADSKALSAADREKIRGRLEQVPSLVAIEKPLSPNAIADAMFSRSGRNLNTVSHETAIDLIVDATLAAKGKLAAVYVDTVGPPESYQRMLQGRFPHLKVIVAKKADAKFPVVSAASIFAKTTRDRSVEAIARQFPECPLGCGYPSDRTTVAWVRTGVHRVFVHPPHERGPFVRASWGPTIELAKQACVPMRFAHEDESEGGQAVGSKRTKGASPSAGDLFQQQSKRHRRDMVFGASMLGLQSVSAFATTL